MQLNDKFKFGKHKGKTLKTVIIEAPKYISWCLDNIKNFDICDEAFMLMDKYKKEKKIVHEQDIDYVRSLLVCQ